MEKFKCPFSKPLFEEIVAKTHINGIQRTVYSVNGDSYTGEWKNDKKHGRGIQKWKNSQLVYEGYWEDGKRCGPGVLSVVDKRGRHTKVYSGMWRNNKRHGYGENWYSGNEFYEGEWFENKRSGWGRYYYKDGSTYEGEWLHDKRWGTGMLRYSNETRYEGNWINDKKNGKGKHIFHSTNQVMDGIWIDDMAKETALSDLGSRQIKTESNIPIPVLGLKSPDTVWRESADENFRILREKYPDDFNE